MTPLASSLCMRSLTRSGLSPSWAATWLGRMASGPRTPFWNGVKPSARRMRTSVSSIAGRAGRRLMDPALVVALDRARRAGGHRGRLRRRRVDGRDAGLGDVAGDDVAAPAGARRAGVGGGRHGGGEQ